MDAKVRRSLAIYEILIGLLAFVAAGVAGAEVGWPETMVALAAGCISLIAGVLLWQDKSLGRKLSLIVQAALVLQISLRGVVQYAVGLGAAVTPHVGFAPQPFQHPIYASLRLGSQVNGFYVGVNVLALVTLLLIATAKQQVSPKSNQVGATA
jgi:hypothetical protein